MPSWDTCVSSLGPPAYKLLPACSSDASPVDLFQLSSDPAPLASYPGVPSPQKLLSWIKLNETGALPWQLLGPQKVVYSSPTKW